MKRFLLPLLIFGVTAGAMAQPNPTPTSPRPEPTMPETITVSGIGRNSVTPDRFTFNVGVQTVANTVDDAVSQNNRKVAAVIAALKAAGARDEDIQTANFNIWPQQDHQEGRLPRILGYQVSNNVNVRSTKVADAGRLLGIAVNAGVNTSSGINFEVSDPARGRDVGLRAAFEDARAKATLLARAAGRNLGPAINISEGVQQVPPHPYAMQRSTAAMEMSVANVPVEAGAQELTFTVTVTFRLQ